MKQRSLIAVLLLVIFSFNMACSDKKAAAVNYDGVYSFDSTTWVTAMKKADPNFSKVPQEMLDKMLDGFKAFNITVKGKTASANFGPMVVSGILEQTSSKDGVVVFKMVPSDADKKDHPIILSITGKGMTAGPDGDEKKLMYFKRP